MFSTRHFITLMVIAFILVSQSFTSKMEIRVYEIGVRGNIDGPSTVFTRDLGQRMEFQSFSFLACGEVVAAASAFLVWEPSVSRAKSRVWQTVCTASKIYMGSTPPRTLNSSHLVVPYSDYQQDFTDWKNMASSQRYGDFRERSPKIQRAA